MFQALITQEIPLAQASRKGKTSGHPSEFPMRAIRNEVRDQESKQEDSSEIIGARTSLGLLSGRTIGLMIRQCRTRCASCMKDASG